jgi:antitoxin component YwqK of YwqJK toxin-antitoxin module
MKKGSIISIVLAISNSLVAQPWKIEKDFRIAFQKDYRLFQEKRGNKTYYIGYSKNDSLRKVFEFQTLPNGNIKDGWFNRFDSSNKESFSILFVGGVAKKLSYINTDSLIFTFSIDSSLLNGVHTVYYANGKIKEYGFYKNNARIGEWSFYNAAGKIVSEGSFEGDYCKLLYDVKKRKIITLNRYLDTAKVESISQKKYDSLKRTLKQQWGVAFPIHMHFKTGIWKYYDDNGKLLKKEFYLNGKLIRSENK